ncbi:hypothetical protein PAECIP111894_01242 [Paenibacillus pseudetheri]|uniref:Uncharacterized protein n=1 Tax=Paenibacillus pseudetheri TaxID=2897682 RepID=A0ABN8FCH5_9BACL|nr:hypothetical protein PAECIP111894_01242 [Paenibacillus pseudetheri]
MKKDKWTIFLWAVVGLEFLQIIYDLFKEHTIRWFSLIIMILLLVSIMSTKISKNKN